MRTLLIISAILFSLPASAQMQMLFGRNAGAGITSPLDVDSIFYWFDAGQGVTTNNSKVTQWNDLSGNGYNVTQADTSKAPTFQATGGPNSRPALYFDGTNDFLTSAAHLWESDDLTVFIVARVFNATRNVQESILRRGESADNTRQFYFYFQNTATAYRIEFNAFRDGGAANFVAYFGGQKSTTYRTIVITQTGTNTGNTLHLNGTSTTYSRFASGTGNDTIFDNTNSRLDIGAANTQNTIVNFLDGFISEIIVYSRALTTAERQAIENYLNKKYNLY
jgi:hypothetical protein